MTTLTILAAWLTVLPAAGELVYNLDGEYSGAWPPEGDQGADGPWLIAAINDTLDGVSLTMQANNLVGSEKIIQWYFSLDLDLSLSHLSFEYLASSTAAGRNGGCLR